MKNIYSQQIISSLLSFAVLAALAGEGATDQLLNALAKRDAQGRIVVLGTEGSFKKTPQTPKEAMFDGDPATFFDPPFAAMQSPCWAGFELPTPKMPTRIRYLGRAHACGFPRAWGCLFQGANRPDFADAVTIHVAAPPMGWNANTNWVEVTLQDASARQTFRFFRVYAPNPYPPSEHACCGGNFAEVEFYGTDRPQGMPPAPAPAKAAPLPLVNAHDTLNEALDLCRRTFDYVAKAVPKEKMRAFRDEMRAHERWARAANTARECARVEGEVRRLRRRILFTHPDLQFKQLLAVQRGVPYSTYSHMVDQYLGRFSVAGPGLIVIDDWKTAPKKKEILKGKLPTGTVFNPDLHWDADRVIFAFCDHTAQPPKDFDPAKYGGFFTCNWTPWMVAQCPDHPCAKALTGESSVVHRRYFIYEATLDGRCVRQLTGTASDPMTTPDGRQTVVIEDCDPCYLPDGGFVFTSTRPQSYGRCHWGRYTPCFLLYRADADGSNIRQLSFGEANEWEPSVLNDGRIVYTRWDYIDRHSFWHQSLWTVKPDGTGVAHLYGNYSQNICVSTEAKAIPGSPLVVGTASPHHGITGGSLFLLDARKGEDGLGPIERLTPESPFPEAEGWRLDRVYNAPMPVNDTLFFCACSEEPYAFPAGHVRCNPGNGSGANWPSQAAFGIWLVDRLGGRELIFKDDACGTFNPIPIIKRQRPPRLASALPPNEKAPDTGIFYVDNVYDSRVKLPAGEIKALRVNRIFNQPSSRWYASRKSQTLFKESLGVAPVAADGSVAFRAPAGVPLQLQAIDETGKAVFTMRSFVYSQKGEVQGCTGCHETRSSSRSAKVPTTLNVCELKPEVDLGYAGPMSYMRTIQPIFEKHCIACHGLGKAKMSLIGEEGNRRLIERRLVSIAYSDNHEHISKPYDHFAAASRLTKILEAGHNGVKLASDEWRKLYLWMDLNIPHHGWTGAYSYSWNPPEARAVDPAGETALRAAVGRILGAEVAKRPLDALVNRADEKLSRVLGLAGGEKGPHYAELLALCRKVFKPHAAHDIAGTCGRDETCECNNCWVRRGGYNLNGKSKAKDGNAALGGAGR